VLLVIFLTISVVLAAVWVYPRSRRWSRLNGLHAVAGRNQRALDAQDRAVLDTAVRRLEAARREYLAIDRASDARRVGQLLGRVAVVRDRVASDYVPTPANAPQGREIPVERSAVTEELGGLCFEVEVHARSGRPFRLRQLVDARRRLRELEREVVEC
jgi:hypothetical protein